jgi:glycosyltransferase involved in cell wall biosynthesis
VVICGDGPARSALEARATDESITNVVFTGYVNKPILDRILGKAAGVVLPAIWPENAPFTVIEAAAAGVPLIVSDMGGLPEMAEIVDGLVVPNGDARALAQSMGRLWDDPDAACERGERGRRAALDYFSKSAHMEALEKIYAEVTRRS